MQGHKTYGSEEGKEKPPRDLVTTFMYFIVREIRKAKKTNGGKANEIERTNCWVSIFISGYPCMFSCSYVYILRPERGCRVNKGLACVFRDTPNDEDFTLVRRV